MAVDLLAIFSFALNALAVAVLTGLFASLVFSTFPKPTIVALIPDTVPVNEGEAIGAFKSNAAFVAVLMSKSASVLFATFPKPTMDWEIPVTVPVKAGSFMGALADKPGTEGASYVPLKSPANFIFPEAVVLALGTSDEILAST